MFIVFSIFSNISESTASNICRRLYIATLVFILSDVLLMGRLMFFIMTDQTDITLAYRILTVIVYLTPIALDVAFVCLRSNRKMWHEFYVNKLRKSHGDRGITMHEITIIEAASHVAIVANDDK